MRPVWAGIPGAFSRDQPTRPHPLGKLEKGRPANPIDPAKIDLFHLSSFYRYTSHDRE
jgi:hypothetical protein